MAVEPAHTDALVKAIAPISTLSLQPQMRPAIRSVAGGGEDCTESGSSIDACCTFPLARSIDSMRQGAVRARSRGR